MIMLSVSSEDPNQELPFTSTKRLPVRHDTLHNVKPG